MDNTLKMPIAHKLKPTQMFVFWLVGFVFYLTLFFEKTNTLAEAGIPLAICLLAVFSIRALQLPSTLTAYTLFFLITVTSLFGFTVSLTGSYTTGSHPLFFGLSFYSASLAYLVLHKSKLGASSAFKISNPMLLATGPIALFVKNIRYKSFFSRLKYYSPFILIGIFYYQIIAVPLTTTLEMIAITDIVSSLVFALIFEIFVYANFCGLSLIIYGLFGVLGYKIPLNFKQPFSSGNVIEFWKGWHISLSIVLKSLFYAPLRKKLPSSLALFGVFLASGMWHGVSYNFLAWGVLHALVFVLTIQLIKKKVRFVPLILLILAVVFGRLIFADSNIDRLLEKLSFKYQGFEVFNTMLLLPFATQLALLLGFSLIGIEFFFRNKKIMLKRNYKFLRTPLALSLIAAITALLAHQVGVDFAVYGQR